MDKNFVFEWYVTQNVDIVSKYYKCMTMMSKKSLGTYKLVKYFE